MRRIRNRRRVKLITNSFLALVAVVLLETRTEFLAPDFKHILEKRVEAIFENKFEFKVDEIEGGIIRPFILKDISINDKSSINQSKGLVINKVKTNYRLLDLLLSRWAAAAKEPSAIINFSLRDGAAKGVIQFKGYKKDLDINGRVQIRGLKDISFSGKIKILEDGLIDSSVKVGHIKLGGQDVSFGLTARITRDSVSGGAAGILGTENLILNYKPASDIKVVFHLEDGVVKIEDMSFGESFKIRGTASLEKPYNLDLVACADNVNITKVLSYFSAQEIMAPSGILNCKAKVEGPLDRVSSDVIIRVKKGRILDVNFDLLEAQLKGEGPMLRIEDSRVLRDSGIFELVGELDLRNLGKSYLFSNVTASMDDKAFLWDDWLIGKEAKGHGITMRKKISEDISFGYKKFVIEDKIDESLRPSSELEVEYKLNSTESVKMLTGEKGEFFGLEHKTRF